MKKIFHIACFLVLAYPVGTWLVAAMIGYPFAPYFILPVLAYVIGSFLTSLWLRQIWMIAIGLILHFSVLLFWLWSIFPIDSSSKSSVVTHSIFWIIFIGLWLGATVKPPEPISNAEQGAGANG